MNKSNGAGQKPESASRSEVVSREGAVLRVERITLSKQMKKDLTTGVRSVGSAGGATSGQRKAR